jgi:regulator of protease activity HflC (stomatin/prohibitin superfamily)
VGALSWQHVPVSASVVATCVVLVALIVVGSASVRAVPPQHTYVVELLGRYRRTLAPGVHVLVPFLESVHRKVNMNEQVANFPPQPAITLDNLVACMGSVLHYRIEDPVRATYEIADPVEGMQMATITILRNLMGSMELARARTSSSQINSQLTEMLNEYIDSWGIRVLRAEITAIETGSERGCD